MNEQIDLLFLGREERVLKIAKGWGREGYSCDETGSRGLGFRKLLPATICCVIQSYVCFFSSLK